MLMKPHPVYLYTQTVCKEITGLIDKISAENPILPVDLVVNTEASKRIIVKGGLSESLDTWD